MWSAPSRGTLDIGSEALNGAFGVVGRVRT
jgi:hypothetical protein